MRNKKNKLQFCAISASSIGLMLSASISADALAVDFKALRNKSAQPAAKSGGFNAPASNNDLVIQGLGGPKNNGGGLTGPGAQNTLAARAQVPRVESR